MNSLPLFARANSNEDVFVSMLYSQSRVEKTAQRKLHEYNVRRRAPPSKMIEGCYRFQCPHCRELRAAVKHRPRMTSNGATPNEVYLRQRPACRLPRWEPRPNWPRASPAASPRVLIKGRPGATFKLHVDRLEARNHLPIVRLDRVA